MISNKGGWIHTGEKERDKGSSDFILVLIVPLGRFIDAGRVEVESSKERIKIKRMGADSVCVALLDVDFLEKHLFLQYRSLKERILLRRREEL